MGKIEIYNPTAADKKKEAEEMPDPYGGSTSGLPGQRTWRPPSGGGSVPID